MRPVYRGTPGSEGHRVDVHIALLLACHAVLRVLRRSRVKDGPPRRIFPTEELGLPEVLVSKYLSEREVVESFEKA